MEEVSEIEVIEMEDNATVVTPTETSSVNSAAAVPQDAAVLPAAPATPEVIPLPFVDEEVTFHKVFFFSHGQRAVLNSFFYFHPLGTLFGQK